MKGRAHSCGARQGEQAGDDSHSSNECVTGEDATGRQDQHHPNPRNQATDEKGPTGQRCVRAQSLEASIRKRGSQFGPGHRNRHRNCIRGERGGHDSPMADAFAT